MSSTNKTANYQLSQFVGTDIPSILNDYNGDMRKIDTAIKDVATAEGSSAADIAGLQATVGQHTTEIGGLGSTVNSLSGRVVSIEGKIPNDASAENPLVTVNDLPEIPSIEGLTERVTTCENDIDSIESKIPANASAGNKLVTEADIPTIPSLDELTNRVAGCENDIDSIESKIPANASTSNKLATMADIPSIGGGSVSYVADFERSDYASDNAFLQAIYTAMENVPSDSSPVAPYFAIILRHNDLFGERKFLNLYQSSNDYAFSALDSIISGSGSNLKIHRCEYILRIETGSSGDGLWGVDCTYNDENSSSATPSYITKKFDLTGARVTLIAIIP